MAIFDDGQRGFLTGLAVGIGAVLVGRQLLAPFRDALRPVTKAGVKGVMAVYERGREAAAHLGESLEDVVAEAKMEQELAALRERAAAQRGAEGGAEGSGEGGGEGGGEVIVEGNGDGPEGANGSGGEA